MTKGIPEAQAGIPAICIVSSSEYWGWLKAIVWWIPWSNAGQFLSLASLLKFSHCLALKWDRIATRSVFTGCYVWMVENDSGLTCLRGNPKAPATTTKNHQTQTFSNVFLAKLGVLSNQTRIDLFQLEIILFNLLVESFRIVDMLWGKPEPRQTDRSRAGHRARWRGVSQLIQLEGRLILLRCYKRESC